MTSVSSDSARSGYATLGRFGSVHGVRGWIKLFSYTEPRLSLFQDHDCFFISRDEREWQPVEFEEHRARSDDFLVKFRGINSPEVARSFTHYYLGVPISDLPALSEGEYYWRELIGLSVFDQHNRLLGVVDHLLETGSNDVLVLNSKPPIAIPYLHGQVIQSIKLEEGRIDVNWETD